MAIIRAEIDTVSIVNTDTVAAGSTTVVIKLTSHTALVNDIIRFTSGTLTNLEFLVTGINGQSAEMYPNLPLTPTAGDSLVILRPTYALINADGTPIGPTGGSTTVFQGTIPWVVSGTVTANAGLNLNTSALQLDITGAKLNLAQNSTTSGQTGPLIQAAVTTTAPSYTTAQTSPLSLTTSGSLRTDSSGTIQPVSGTIAATQSGTWNINNISGVISLPTSASTSALQITGNTSLSSIDTKLSSQATAVKQDTGNTSLASIDTKTATLGQKNMAGSSPVVIASDQSAIPITVASVPLPTGAATEATLAKIPLAQASTTSGQSGVLIQGAVSTASPAYTTGQTDPISLTTAGAVRTDSSATTQPISASTLPLPVGASTSTNQDTANASLASIDAGIPAALGAANIANSMPVNIASDQTVPVSAVSLPLPTGAATSALQTSGNTTLTSINGKLADNYGAAATALRTAAQLGNTAGAADFNTGTTSAQTLRVVLPTDQTSIPVVSTPASGTKATYSAAVVNSGLSTPAFGISGIFFTLSGSATKTVTVTKISLSGVQTNAGQIRFGLELITFLSGGTPTVVTPAAHKSTNAAATAVATQYASGATPGSLTNTLFRVWNTTLVTNATNTEGTIISETFGNGASQPFILTNGYWLAFLQYGAGAVGASMNIYIEWTEE